ncbi:AMP-binding enzyme [Babesia caballi]|uniref:AMP-binding enzyme n=1 Tax=Babesia caballi TaxID=5871 RepID=A0AAV4LZR0_BABCB|nr:AMP-binding enzyme [Babesia caballi]
MVICAHLKHSKLHDFYIIAACLIYGYTLLHTNWHVDNEDTLVYKLRAANCRLVIVDDEISTDSMVPDIKYLRLSDVYAQSIYRKSLSLNSYLSLVESLGKERSDYRIQEMLSEQSKLVGAIDRDAVLMITFSTRGPEGLPSARKVTYGEMAGHFEALESMGAWRHDDVLVVFMTNPTYDFFTSVVLYYCLCRGNVHIHFLQRYMSTYWKILWESNEHAKNVFTQLGKSYKILSFLFPRQLEALLTLEEIALECKVFADGSPAIPKHIIPRKAAISEELIEASSGRTEQSDSTTQESPPPGRVDPAEDESAPETGQDDQVAQFSSLDAVRAGITTASTSTPENTATAVEAHSSAESSPRPPTNTSAAEGPTATTADSPNAAHGSASFHREDSGHLANVYIPKLHLKFTELRSVLCDKSVLFLLSGTHASVDLCRLLAALTGGKTPVIRYGCTEVSPTVGPHPLPPTTTQITLVPPGLNQHHLLDLYKIGVDNRFNNNPAPGHYIGTAVSPDRRLRVVKSVDPADLNFLLPCEPSEPGYFVCNAGNRASMLLPEELSDCVLKDGTYLGMHDVGFFVDAFDARHFYWCHKVDHSAPRGVAYPYLDLLCTSRLVQQSICVRYDLTEPVVRVETVLMPQPNGNPRIVSAVELITSMRAEIAEDLKSSFLDVCSRFFPPPLTVPRVRRHVRRLHGAGRDSRRLDSLGVQGDGELPSAAGECARAFRALTPCRTFCGSSHIMSPRFNLRTCQRLFVGSAVTAAAAAAVSENLVTLRWVRPLLSSSLTSAGAQRRDVARALRARRFPRPGADHPRQPVLPQRHRPLPAPRERRRVLRPSRDDEHAGRRGSPPQQGPFRPLLVATPLFPVTVYRVENDNPRSDEPDSNTFGASPFHPLVASGPRRGHSGRQRQPRVRRRPGNPVACLAAVCRRVPTAAPLGDIVRRAQHPKPARHQVQIVVPRNRQSLRRHVLDVARCLPVLPARVGRGLQRLDDLRHVGALLRSHVTFPRTRTRVLRAFLGANDVHVQLPAHQLLHARARQEHRAAEPLGVPADLAQNPQVDHLLYHLAHVLRRAAPQRPVVAVLVQPVLQHQRPVGPAQRVAQHVHRQDALDAVPHGLLHERANRNGVVRGVHALHHEVEAAVVAGPAVLRQHPLRVLPEGAEEQQPPARGLVLAELPHVRQGGVFTQLLSRDHLRLRRGARLLAEVPVALEVAQVVPQYRRGEPPVPPRSSDFLVVPQDRDRRRRVEHEPDVRLVYPHPEGDGRYHDAYPPPRPPFLHLLPRRYVQLRVVGAHRDARLPQRPRHLFAVADGERVHDAAPRQRLDDAYHLLQVVLALFAALDPQVRPVDCRPQPHAGRYPQHLHDVLRDVRRRRRRHRQDRHVRVLGLERAQVAVVLPEGESPVRDAVRLVDHEQLQLLRVVQIVQQPQQRRRLAELLRRDEQYRPVFEPLVEVALRQLPHGRSRGARVYGIRVDSVGPQHPHLVLHQRYQRREHHYQPAH